MQIENVLYHLTHVDANAFIADHETTKLGGDKRFGLRWAKLAISLAPKHICTAIVAKRAVQNF